MCQYVGWRWAFLLPGAASVGVGVLFMQRVRHEVRRGAGQGAAARVPKGAMPRVLAAMVLTVIAGSATFNAITVALPQLLAERLATLTVSPATLGLIAAGIYLCGAVAQYTIGGLIDRHPLRTVFLPLSFVLSPLLLLGSLLSGVPMILAAIGIIVGMFGQVTVNDAMVGKYTSEEWRSRAFAARYFLGFTIAGASVGTVAWLHDHGGFALMLQSFAGLCLLVIVGALAFPKQDQATPARAPAPAE